MATCTQNKTVIENNGTSETRNNGDLFWALRGGGGGTFGVVVHYVLKLHPAPTSVVTVSITVPLYQNNSDIPLAQLLLEKYAEWLNTAPFYWGGFVVLSSKMAMAKLTKYGPFDLNTDSELQPFNDLKGLYPGTNVINITLANHSSYGATLSPDPARERSYIAGALIPAEKNNASLWNFLVPDRLENDVCGLIRLGGE